MAFTTSSDLNDMSKLQHHAIESELINWHYENCYLTIDLRTYDDDNLHIQILTGGVKTQVLDYRTFSNLCRVELVDVTTIIPVNSHGYFVPPQDFTELMKVTRKGYALWFGEKAIMKYAFSLCSASYLITCSVKDMSDIRWFVHGDDA